MLKPMLKKPQVQTQSASLLSATQHTGQKDPMEEMKLDRILRKPRSEEYVKAVSRLDAGGHVCNKQQVDEIINTIQAELPEVELSDILIGYVSKCSLGKPYEVHTLDFSGQIIEHYKAGQTLPSGMEKARGIAMYGSYEFIEVYVDCCRAVSANGTVSVIPG